MRDKSNGNGRTPGAPNVRRDSAVPVHLILCARDGDRLECALSAVARLQRAPDTMSVSVDGEDARMAELCRIHSLNTGMRVRLTQRRSHGTVRLAQTRNNAVRTLFATGVKRGLLVFIAGDTVLAADTLGQHVAAAAPRTLLIGDRICLTHEQTQRLYSAGTLPSAAELIAEHRRLRQRDRRARVYLWLRHLGLCRAHLPNVVGAHFAVDLETFVRVNGFDEHIEGDHGWEDHDFARRAYAAGVRPRSVIARAIAYRLFPDGAGRPRPSPNPGRPDLARTFPVRTACGTGLRTPLPQNPPRIRVF